LFSARIHAGLVASSEEVRLKLYFNQKNKYKYSVSGTVFPPAPSLFVIWIFHFVTGQVTDQALAIPSRALPFFSPDFFARFPRAKRKTQTGWKGKSARDRAKEKPGTSEARAG
jgi:hypothetical protein